MNQNDSPSSSARPSVFLEKVIVLCLGVLGTIALMYLSWYQLPILLWTWVKAVWWHFVPAFFAYTILAVMPVFAIIGLVSVFKAKPHAKRILWLMAIAVLAGIAVLVLILWIFLPSGTWWKSGYWWLWTLTVIALSILSVGARMFINVLPVEVRKARASFSHEWRFNHGDTQGPPALGLAMSGGGIRSAAFNLGVLQALHEAGILRQVDVMSAVSGGTYIMSWYLLQPFYAAKAHSPEAGEFNIAQVFDEMFDPDGRYQAFLVNHSEVVNNLNIGIGAVFGATLMQPIRALILMGDESDGNNGSNVLEEYRKGIQKLFQSHPGKGSQAKIENDIPSTWKQDDTTLRYLTVQPVTYGDLATFTEANGLPFFIFNCAALVARRYRDNLWPTAFEFTADDLGADVCGYRRWDDLEASDEAELRTLRTRAESHPKWMQSHDSKPRSAMSRQWLKLVNVTPAISGAAIGLARFDPNKPERAMKFSTWMPFIGNVDLGYLLPRKVLNTESAVYVSDGGHADNLGAYALIRRNCRTMIIVDAEHEAGLPYVFEGYRKLKARLKEEQSQLLQVEAIDAYLDSRPKAYPPPVMTGTVTLANESLGEAQKLSVVYIKLALDQDADSTLPPEVLAYAAENPLFPQDPTTNQSFSAQQFKAYRDLGKHVGSQAVAHLGIEGRY